MEHHSSISLIRNTKELLAKDWNVKIIHVYREANQCANALAKKCQNSNLGVSLFSNVPSFT